MMLLACLYIHSRRDTSEDFNQIVYLKIYFGRIEKLRDFWLEVHGTVMKLNIQNTMIV